MLEAINIWVDGESYTIDDLSYREQRKVNQFAASLTESGSFEDALIADVIPAMVTVLRQRTDEAFTLEQALDLKPADVEHAPVEKRPTRARAKAAK